MDVLRPDLLDSRSVRLPVVVGQAVDRERLDRPGDPRGCLEAQREDADEEVTDLGELTLVRRRGADPLELPDQLADRIGRDLGLDRGGRGERPGGPTRVEGAARSIRVAELLAQPEVQAAAEDAAEQRSHDHRREIARVGAVDPEVPDPQLGLDRSGPIDEHDPPPAALARLDRPVSPARAAPVAEAALDGPQRFVRLDRPGDDQVRDARRVSAAWNSRAARPRALRPSPATPAEIRPYGVSAA